MFRLIALLLIPGALFAQALELKDPGWKLNGNVKAEPHLGREALRMGTGTAWYPAARFQDGTVEFDVAMTTRRSFVGVRFRAASEEVWEEFYLRAHKSGLPDAIQYAPAFAGARSNWQLYHGPGETAFATFAPDMWMHVKVVVKGDRAAIFLNGSTTPSAVVPRLGHEAGEGFVGLWSFDASQPPQEGFSAAISNFVVRPGVVDFTFPEVPAQTTPPGLITSWRVSSSFAPPESGQVVELPRQIVAGEWKSAASDPRGLVVLDRHASRPAGVRRISALAKVNLRAEKATNAKFNFGFSDDVSVFLNGRLLFSAVNGYNQNFPRREGLMTLDERTLYLPLRAGDNELILAVTESTIGGWGLMGQFPEQSGFTVR